MKKLLLFVWVFTLFLFAGCEETRNVYTLEMANGYPVVTGSENDLMWYIDDPENLTTRLNQMTYSNALDYCSKLDHSDFTDWRLPTIDELRTLVEGYGDMEPGGRCQLTESCLHKTCLFRGQKSEADYPCANKDESTFLKGPGPDGCYFDDVWRAYCGKYWSSSEVRDSENQIFQIDFGKPSILTANKDATSVGFARCVRKK